MTRLRIDWRKLEYFRVAGRLQHVTRAAEELNTSQPALSRALARLEHELGVPLFAPRGRSIRLTRYGEVFLNRIERALKEVDEGLLELGDLANPRGGVIELGFLRTLGAEFVPQLVRQFGEQFPEVRFHLTPNYGAALAEQLQNGGLDLAFCAEPLEGSPLSWMPVKDQDLILIVSRSHPLAECGQVALADVCDEKFVAFKSGAIRRLTDALCAKAGFVPSIVFEGHDSSSVPGLVAAGCGVAVVPPESGKAPGVVGLRITNPSPRRAIGVAWIDGRYLPASARAFRDFVIAMHVKAKPSVRAKRTAR